MDKTVSEKTYRRAKMIIESMFAKGKDDGLGWRRRFGPVRITRWTKRGLSEPDYVLFVPMPLDMQLNAGVDYTNGEFRAFAYIANTGPLARAALIGTGYGLLASAMAYALRETRWVAALAALACLLLAVVHIKEDAR